MATIIVVPHKNVMWNAYTWLSSISFNLILKDYWKRGSGNWKYDAKDSVYCENVGRKGWQGWAGVHRCAMCGLELLWRPPPRSHQMIPPAASQPGSSSQNSPAIRPVTGSFRGRNNDSQPHSWEWADELAWNESSSRWAAWRPGYMTTTVAVKSKQGNRRNHPVLVKSPLLQHTSGVCRKH